jgi:hypothetical protein
VFQPQQSTVRNRLLKALSPADFALLQPHLQPTATALRQTLIAPNEAVTQLFFPETGYASLVTQGSKGNKAEAAIIGREGLVGVTPVLLGADRTPHHIFIQAPGEMLSSTRGRYVPLSIRARACANSCCVTPKCSSSKPCRPLS